MRRIRFYSFGGCPKEVMPPGEGKIPGKGERITRQRKEGDPESVRGKGEGRIR
jgi:hypothetical protein